MNVIGHDERTFARSVDHIVALEHSITRMAVATETEAESRFASLGEAGGSARVHRVPESQAKPRLDSHDDNGNRGVLPQLQCRYERLQVQSG